MRILYSPCHEVLEFDELRMFSDEGHAVFSLGNHFDPQFPGNLRPQLPHLSNQHLFEEFHRTGCNLEQKLLTKEFLSNFDVVVLMHDPALLINNRSAFGDIPVVLRTIGQSHVAIEKAYRDLGERINIVRYSHRETSIDGFAKTDAVIYFGKYISDYLPWSGKGQGITFHNSYSERNHSTVPAMLWRERFAVETGTELWGVGSEGLALARGRAPHEQIKFLFSNASWYFYVYTYPPSYTLSLIEAMFAGVPIIAPSVDLVDRLYASSLYAELTRWSPDRYEVESLVGDGGAFYDTIAEAIQSAARLLSDIDCARRCSEIVRQNALRYFDARVIARQWTKFLSALF